MAEIALAWLLSRPGVTAPIIGATKLSHLETAIKATVLRLRSDEVEQLEVPYVPHAVRGHN
jgi:aryl-alcohol dehydrogenase-like predicted oxidoreductase